MANELVLIIEDNEKTRKLIRDLLQVRADEADRVSRTKIQGSYEKNCKLSSYWFDLFLHP